MVPINDETLLNVHCSIFTSLKSIYTSLLRSLPGKCIMISVISKLNFFYFALVPMLFLCAKLAFIIKVRSFVTNTLETSI